MTTIRNEEENTVPAAPSRSLNEDVLQSAEQAVLSSPASEGILAPDGPDTAAPGVLVRYRESLASQVARKPGQSVLLALAAGALAAVALRSAVSRRGRLPLPGSLRSNVHDPWFHYSFVEGPRATRQSAASDAALAGATARGDRLAAR
ncbi:hypothetical protein [Polaromonas sp.]|jgi:hypothetical protein|uniref:hypothetical protein n=1 Tax=Polaromonas sp. TaxID=1869339 RepID=UPI0037C9567C